MDSHFTITINDDNGVRQFNLHHFMKKITLYVVILFGIIILIAVGTILYLDSAVDKIEQKRLYVEKSYNSLKSKNALLDQNIKDTEIALDLKREELLEVSDSLSEIETLIGLAPPEDIALMDRVNITKLNSQSMATLLQFIPNGSPIEYKGLTSKFGYRIHPTLNRREFHRGSDLRAKMKTAVYSTADGVVEYSGYHKKSGYGNLIIVQHNYGFKTYYGHLNKVVIKSGKYVKKGDLIGYTGNSGMSNGPHLHYEVRFIARALNPFWFIKWTVQNYQEIFEKEKKVPWQSLITVMNHIKVQSPTQTLPLSLQDQQLKGK